MTSAPHPAKHTTQTQQVSRTVVVTSQHKLVQLATTGVGLGLILGLSCCFIFTGFVALRVRRQWN